VVKGVSSKGEAKEGSLVTITKVAIAFHGRLMGREEV
jgi:hypothetical protein